MWRSRVCYRPERVRQHAPLRHAVSRDVRVHPAGEVQGGTLGIAVDLWDGEVTVGAITTNGPADKEGTLIQGDIIRAVDGTACATIEEVTMCVIKGGIKLELSICRRPVTTVLETEVNLPLSSILLPIWP